MGLKRRAYRKYTLPLPLSSPAFAGGSLHHTPLGPAHGVIHIGSTCLAERGRPLLALQAASDAALSGGMGVGKGNQLHVRRVISGMSPFPAAPKAAADVDEHKPNRSNSPSKQIAQVQGMVAALAPGPLVWLAGEQRLDPEQACAALAGKCSSPWSLLQHWDGADGVNGNSERGNAANAGGAVSASASGDRCDAFSLTKSETGQQARCHKQQGCSSKLPRAHIGSRGAGLRVVIRFQSKYKSMVGCERCVRE